MIETSLRQRIDLSRGWEFVRGRVGRRWLQGRGVGGETVDLPHCWNRTDTFQYGRSIYMGRGAYRRVLDLTTTPDSTGHWRLRSEGFYGFGDVWLDGRTIARIDGQYLGFDIDFPGSLGNGLHQLAFRLDNLFQKRVLPGRRDPDFLLYGGLAGRVWLEWTPSLRIDERTVQIVGAREPNGAEILELKCGVIGLDSSAGQTGLSWEVTAANGDRLAAARPSPIRPENKSASAMILNPSIWSPENPNLYWAECRLESEDGTVDSTRVRFGITHAEFQADEGFFLDGHRVDLHGCNRHESIPGLGNALPDELHRADAQLLKDYGCNFVRLSHYPQHPTFLDACDELGILVYAEIATWKSVSSSNAWRHAARRQMRDLIIRDRHHPSIILWGMGNESRSRKVFLELHDIARELDPTRPVTYAENHLYRARRHKTDGIPDVWAVNYELDALEEARNASILRNVVVAECCNFPHSVRGDDGAELTQVATLEYEWKLLTDRPYLAGYAVWAFTDYATEYRKRHRRQPGLFDAWRQPKMAAELFRARYSEEPFTTLIVTGSGESRKLHIFSNCASLWLAIDDRSPVDLEGSYHYEIDLGRPFTELVVDGECNGQGVRETLHSWQPAATISLAVDEAEMASKTTIAVDLTVVDSNGTWVRDWDGHVQVSAQGDGRLLTYTENSDVVVARGEGRVFLALGAAGGEVVITAEADGLEEGTKKISFCR